MSSATSRARQRGTSALEFALIGSVFMLLMIGIFDLGRYFAVVEALHTLLTTTVRAAEIGTLAAGGTCPSSGLSLPASLTASVPILEPSQLCVTVSSNTVSGQTQTTAAAQYSFTFLLPSWSGMSGTINDSTTLTY